jgi:uncharacterized damage-inducible protein DinB
MTEVERVGDLLRRVFEGETPWHGSSLKEILAGITATQAAQRPLPAGHSIWELVHHIAAWKNIVRRRIAGETVVGVSGDEDWPPVVDTGEAAWTKALEGLEREHQQLRQAVAGLSDDRLGEQLLGTRRNYSLYETLHGIIQHDLYHAGQIAVLKKGLQ